jgi:hypothetical protein
VGGGWRKILAITLPVSLASVVLATTVIEIGVRAAWNPRNGRPGFFLNDAVRGLRLAPGYDGWFAGVPVHINQLELRDTREYDLAKRANTFRILVLGDSVTFGHGSVHTYPELLEQRLNHWRPDVDWQVWNAAVPGYNTSQELAHLLEVGDRFQPDLVIVGFFENDLIENHPVPHPGPLGFASARVISFLRQHVYSLELYRKVYLTLRWRLSGSDAYRQRLDQVNSSDELLMRSQSADAPEQRLTPYLRLTDEDVAQVSCYYGMKPNPAVIRAMEQDPGFPAWTDAVQAFQQLNREGRFRVVFFANDVPPACPDGDVFYDGGSKAVDALFMRILGDGTPAVSSFDAFLHVHPSQMPNATAHAVGNANDVKAEVLFTFLRDRILPPLLPGAAGSRRPQP